MSKLQRDHYGPPEPVMAPGDLEYRFEFVEPAWTESAHSTDDLQHMLSEFDDMGRKRTPKREWLADIMRSWYEADVYGAIRLVTGSPQPHPGLAMDIEENAVHAAVSRVYDVDPEELSDEYSTLAQGLLRDATADARERGEPVSISELYGKWVYLLQDAGSPTRQEELLVEMFERCSEPAVIVQAVLPKMALYCGSSLVYKAIRDVYEPDDEFLTRAYRTTGDVACLYVEALRGELDDQLYPHSPHGAMKAQSIDAADVAELTEEDWLGQYKYDGARLFIHHAGDGDVRAYTSGLKDVTNALPELKELDWPQCPFVFDAEATPYDEDGNVVPFENVMTRITRVDDVDAQDEDIDVVLKVFDCALWHGRDITQRKYTNRFEIVRRIFPPDHVARTGDDLEAIFQSSVEDGHEGLVLKEKTGTYTCGGRPSQWRKWKQEPETLDVVVSEVVRGGGRHSDRMGALRVAVKEPESEEYIDVGRVGTGFSDEERDEWWVRSETAEAIGSIIEVEYEDLQKTGDEWALRFPRFKRERDKSEASVDDIERAARLAGRDDEYMEWEATWLA